MSIHLARANRSLPIFRSAEDSDKKTSEKRLFSLASLAICYYLFALQSSNLFIDTHINSNGHKCHEPMFYLHLFVVNMLNASQAAVTLFMLECKQHARTRTAGDPNINCEPTWHCPKSSFVRSVQIKA